VLARHGSRWAGLSASALTPQSPPLYCYVLDADDDLAQVLDVRTGFTARQLATARAVDAQPGECDLEPWFVAAGHGPGLLLLEGLLAVHTRIVDRTVTELVGAGDLLQPARHRTDEMIERATTWRALRTTRFALLDEEFDQRVLPWPQIAHALLRRAERRTADLDAVRAISCQPRLAVRLVLLFWHLAGRWGRVESAGIRLSLPLTHRLLGQLVSAERPSVTHALTRLAEARLVTGTPGDWHLHGRLDEHLESLIERTAHLEPGGRRARAGGSGQVA
jgi:CRP/FNR family cyclic AMP-dependent transcriptional regulator